MNDDLYTTLARDNTYLDLRVKSLIVHSYADGYNVSISQPEQAYALYNPPSAVELNCLQAAKQQGKKGKDPTIR